MVLRGSLEVSARPSTDAPKALNNRPSVPAPSAAPVQFALPWRMALRMDQRSRSGRALSILKLKVSSVTSVARADDGWRVSVELVERAGVPDMNDVLGLYELLSPGMIGRLVGSPVGAWLLGGAAAMQATGAVLVRRLARVDS